MDNYLDATRRVIDDNFDDSRLVDFDLIIKNVEVRGGVLERRVRGEHHRDSCVTILAAGHRML